MSDPITVRPAAPGDFPFVRALSREAFARFGQYEETLSREFTEPGTVTLIGETGGVDSQGAGGEVRSAAGFAMYTFVVDEPPEAYLIAIAVSLENRRKGIARRLLEAVEARILDAFPGLPVPGISLNVAVDNDRAIALFRRAGYAPGRGDAFRYPAGQASLSLRKQLVSRSPRG